MMLVLKTRNRVEVALIKSNWPDVTGTEEGLVKGKSAEEKRKPERVFSGHRVKNFVTVIRVDGELPKEQIREDAKPLEELTFTSALPFLLM